MCEMFNLHVVLKAIAMGHIDSKLLFIIFMLGTESPNILDY